MSKRKTRSSPLEITLHDFIRIGDAKAVAKLISQGVNVNMNENNDYGLTPLTVAASCGHKEIVKLLLEAKATVNLSGSSGDLPLSMAKDVSTAKILVDAGADVNFVNRYGLPVLHCAIRQGKFKIIKYLLSCGANPNTPCFFFYTPLLMACTPLFCRNGCHKKIVKCLLENDANPFGFKNREPLPNFLNKCARSTQTIDEKVKFLRFLLKYFHVDTVTHIVFTPEKLYKIFLEHVAKLLSLGVSVQSFYDFIKYRADYLYHLKECLDELIKAKKTKLPNSWVTYFNLLVDNKRKLKNYAGNEELIENFKKSDCCKKFPIYGESMKENVEKGIKIRYFFDYSTLLLSKYLPVFDATHLVIKDILDYFGSKDLMKFCKK